MIFVNVSKQLQSRKNLRDSCSVNISQLWRYPIIFFTFDYGNSSDVMKTRIFSVLLFLVLLVMPIMVMGQANKPTITLHEKEFNFGTLKESDGIIVHDFLFTNEGKTPLIINDVKASCGCTAPEWPHEPVLPGKNGVIKVSFNPYKQTGAFNKTVQINSNADFSQVVIAVKGVVIPVDRVEDVYKYTVGNIRLETIYASFGEIYKGKMATHAIKVLNTSADKSVTLTFRKIPDHLKIKVVPEVIEPQQEGRIEIQYMTSGINEWDYVVDRLELLINEQVFPNNRINITANIKEDFSTISADELVLAPDVEFDSHQFDFGKITGDKPVEHAFKLTNKGKSDLFIRKVTATCGCTAVQPAKTTIAPGDSTLIKAVFNPAGREGNQRKAITIITNAPKHSKSILWINAVVEKAPSNKNQ
jgi:hypothetical protein